MKAYILRIDTPNSIEYAKTASDSCEAIGLEWEYVKGYQNQTGKMAFKDLNIPGLPTEPYSYIKTPTPSQKAMCCTAGHYRIWKKIAEGPDDVGIVLEHDALMLHPITVQVPENTIVVLGYKLQDKDRYDHVGAGPPRDLIRIDGHEGAHAYAMTKRTAKFLINEIQTIRRSAVDNDYFIRGQRQTAMPLTIASPTPAIAWLRESTIWHNSANRNYDFIPSFHKYYK
jgi:GR25 family glycosyltransferase involved in LPS biosynthesis|tara:strand:- start:96 stop:776 length:681 start_codon:yes stop_codon:yes gene_type:complete